MSFIYFWDKTDSFGSNEEGFPFLICKKKQKTKTKTKQKKTKQNIQPVNSLKRVIRFFQSSNNDIETTTDNFTKIYRIISKANSSFCKI